MNSTTWLAGRVTSLLPNVAAVAETPQTCFGDCAPPTCDYDGRAYPTLWLCCVSGCWDQNVCCIGP